MNTKNAATINNGAVDRDFLVPQLSFATTSATGPPETKRHLRFSPTTMIMPTLALSDYTDKEYDATWTTEDDDVKSGSGRRRRHDSSDDGSSTGGAARRKHARKRHGGTTTQRRSRYTVPICSPERLTGHPKTSKN